MRILITGGAGFIGSHLSDRLLEDDHQIVVFDNLSTGRKSNIEKHFRTKDFQLIDDSILHYSAIESQIKEADYVFHLAAAVGVFNIVKKPIDSLITNIRGTENVLLAAHKFEKPVFIASSSEVYGKNTSDSLSESDDRILGSPTTLRWSYSEAKAIDESLAFAYWAEKNLESRIVRFFNTVGPRQLGTYGMVVPRFIQAALKDEPLTIYGTGEQTRCFMHVYDAVDAIMKVAFSENTVGKVVNIGNNFEISVADLANLVIDITKSNSPVVYQAYSDAYGDGFEDMDRRIPNIDLIKSLTSWEPKRDLPTIISDISDSLKL
jgi:UDP-glucose 4-epimerase